MPPTFRHASCGAFFKHWDELREGAVMPHTRRFLDRAPHSLMRTAFIFEVYDHGLLVRFMGTELVGLCQQDFTGCYFDTIVEHGSQSRILADTQTVCSHPAAARALTHTETTKARMVETETICVPLAVDDDRPPRCVQYRDTGEKFNFDEFTRTFHWPKSPDWIDIGAGVPDAPSRKRCL